MAVERRALWRRAVAASSLTAVAFGGTSVAPPSADASPTGHHDHAHSHFVQVPSRVQEIYIGTFKAGQSFDVQYLGGEWTVGGQQNYSGPKGLDEEKDRGVWPEGDQVGRSCRVTDDLPYGAAIGDQGGKIFPIREGVHYVAKKTGPAAIGINDNDYLNPNHQRNCLQDNYGTIVFQVTTYN